MAINIMAAIQWKGMIVAMVEPVDFPLYNFERR
jgi:hypothetical protein